MTTYVLHGGKTKIDSLDNALFFQQFTHLVQKDNVKILLCYWARDTKSWNELFENDKIKILKQSIKKTEIYIIDNVKSLITQLKTADVLYFSGGEEEFLRPYMSHLSFLKDALKNKIFIGSSMGSFLAAKHYVLSLSRQNEDIVHEGLGLVPYNTLCHWNVEKNKEIKINMLRKSDPQTPLLLIEEQKFEKIEI